MSSIHVEIEPQGKIHVQTVEKHGDCHENQSINLDPFFMFVDAMV